ncbi:MAG: 23S rRNA (uracil(1939)-C(5))-methyltransferase RlmD [Bacteroidales bacterium]|nr:23S rRNA (uracil(1939)-C(5))-methyltransferase RlmD [Bacteroidales bacterium]
MGGRSRHKPLLENLLITDIAAEGKAIARHEGMVVFVSQCVPGDVVDVQVIRKRKRFMEGYPVKFHAYSPDREKPFCDHFGVCGGCKWQHLPYREQLRFKQQQVVDALERIGKAEVKLIMPIVASDSQKFYRNKLEYTFSHSRWLTSAEIQSGESMLERRALGFHIPGKFDKVLDIITCYLQPEPSNQIRNFVKQYALENNLEFFDLVQQKGFLRTLLIRNNAAGEVMVVFSFFKRDHELMENLLNAVSNNFPQIASLMYVINPKANDTLNDLNVELFRGQDHLVEKMEDLEFRISPKSFFQTNTRQAYRLYCIAREFAGLTGKEIVYDLYTGTGTIALFLARSCRKVVGLEFVSEAVEDAKANAQLNGISNSQFLAGDIRELLTSELMDQHGHPDVIITDPPRTGMHADVIQAIIETRPDRIVYVSCNPATQARDIQLLSEHYKLAKSQPVDMFPYTHHVENVALLEALPWGS